MKSLFVTKVSGQTHLSGYQMISRIGQGRQSIVYRVSKDDQSFVLINTQFSDELLKILNKLKGDSNVIQLVDAFVRTQPLHQDIFRFQKDFFIVCDFISNDSFVKVIRNVNELLVTDESSAMAQVIHLTHQLLSLLLNLHNKNIFHLDIRPDNILIKDGQCYLIDFGSAQLGRIINRKDAQYLRLIPDYYDSQFDRQVDEPSSHGSINKSRQGLFIGNKMDLLSLGVMLREIKSTNLLFIDIVDQMTVSNQFMRPNIQQLLNHQLFKNMKTLVETL